MRRFVRDRVAAALERQKPMLEEYISQYLVLPLGFPYDLAPAAVLLREVRSLKIVPLPQADFPPLKIETQIKIWLTSRAVELHSEWHPGLLDADVELMAHGAVAADGSYNVEPRSAVLKAWWRDAEPAARSRSRGADGIPVLQMVPNAGLNGDSPYADDR